MFSQIVDYSDKRFMDHIKKHLTNSDLSDEEKSIAVFTEDFPIDKVFSEIKNNTPSNYKIYSGLVEDLYMYKYDLCGKHSGKNCDYFKVITLHDTDNFITMCPCLDNQNNNSVDLNYLREEKIKQKKLSQIDKFNQRYNKMLDK